MTLDVTGKLSGVLMPNRTLCDVLKEIRKCYETRNFSYLAGLVEEVQTLGNRMEAALWDQHELKNIRKSIKEAKLELTQLKAEISANEELKKLIK